jgi:Prasinovirus endonuclease VII
MTEAQRKYRQSAKGRATARARDRRRADARRERNRAYVAQWRETHSDYQRARYRTDANARIADNLRSSLQAILSRLVNRQRLPRKWRGDSRIGQLLGCDPPEFIAHIERQFQIGMSWENRGQWYVSHIKQCHNFDLTDATQQAECFHFTNLCPLWETDSRRRLRMT